MRNHSARKTDEEDGGALLDAALRLYAQLDMIARSGEMSDAVRAEIDRVAADFDAAAPMLSGVMRDLDRQRAPGGATPSRPADSQDEQAVGIEEDEIPPTTPSVSDRLAAALDAARHALKSSGTGRQSAQRGAASEQLPRRFRTLTPTERKALAAAMDPTYYLEQASEAGIAVTIEPVLHYLREGARAGLSPHPLFDPEYYLSENGLRSDDLPPYADFVIARNARGAKPHPLFDPDYYLAQNPDVARTDQAAHQHYVKYGWKEDRAPNAWFRPLWYISQNPDVLKGGEPLQQYALLGESQGYRPHPSFDPDWYRDTHLGADETISPLRHHLERGDADGLLTQPQPNGATTREQDDRITLLCVAHSASERLYGSERSFLDVLSSVDRTRYRIIAALPVPKAAYVDRVMDVADHIVFTKRRWWKEGTPVDDAMIRHYEGLIDAEDVQGVYANTIMLREPLIAARNRGIPAICHMREAIRYDEDLQEEIGLDADAIIDAVVSRSDYRIANSDIMADMFGGGESVHTVYNAVDVDGTLGRARWRGRGPLVAGALSSNIPKKGIADIAELAIAAHEAGLDVEFKLFGPLTEEAARIDKMLKRRKITNLSFPGYVDNAKLAVAQLDVMLNFSHFAESFGRTIAEAGAAARPSIVYDHGALPEVVEDGVTGVVIPYREPLAALDVLKSFITDPKRYTEMGQAARIRAESLFSRPVLSERINAVFDTIMEETETSRSSEGRTFANGPSLAGETAPVSVIVPNYNYEDYLPERLRSIMEQTRPPAEIIFLDDASPDNSVAVAEEILADSDIPHRILASEENLGVYRQWLRGLAHANQPWVWIAEADDSAEEDFLEKLLMRAEDDVNIIYAQSRKIDGDGHVTAPDNRAHSNAVSPTRWARDYKATGAEEVTQSLAFRNTIPNASAVLLRRDAISGLETKLLEMKYTGDWLLYAHMLRTGGIAFVSEPLNHFRRHARSVTRVAGRGVDYLEELARIRLFMAEHFPLRSDQFERMNRFLDMDYKIEGEAKNSEADAIADLQNALRRELASKRHFAFITTNNGSHYGGSEMLWRESALALRDRGHEVSVLIKRWEPRPDFFDAFEARGITLLYKGEGGFQALREMAPDLCVVSLGDQDEGLEFYPGLQEDGLPYVIVNQLTKEARFWPVRAAKTDAVAAGYQGAERAFFTSWNNHRVMEDRLASPLPNGAIHFNPYHIDRTHVPDWPDSDRIHIAIPSKLLFIHKGQDILAEFLGKPEWQERALTFNFYGIGPDEDALKALAEKNGISNFEFHGRVADIGEIWERNQALLMPSRMEGLPIMLVSAMLSARVPIVTDIGGHAEVVTDGECGFIAPDPSADDVENALRRALARHDEWPEIGRKARAAILDFLPEDPVEDFIGKIEGLVGIGEE